MPVDWGRGSCTIEPTSAAIRPPEGSSVQERVKWYREWSQTEAGIAYSIHRHAHAFKPGADGAFRIDLPAGSYAHSVHITEAGGRTQPGLEWRTLATFQRVFLVPDILPDRNVDSMDLGNLEVNVVQRLRVGDLAPAFACRRSTAEDSDWRIIEESTCCCISGRLGAEAAGFRRHS